MFGILRNLSLANQRMAPKGLNGLVVHFLIHRNFVDFMKIIYTSFYESVRVHHKLCLWGIVHNRHKFIPFSMICFIHLFICLFRAMRDVHNFTMHKSHITCAGALQRSSV